MITSVHAKKVLALHDVFIALEPFTIITGPNGSGKTTLLRSLTRGFAPAVSRVLITDDFDETGHVLSEFDPKSQYLAVNSQALRTATYLGDPFQETGFGLGAVLARVRLEQIDGPQRLAQLLGQIIPGVVNVGIEGNQLFPFVEFEHVGKVSVEQLSEGTLFALAIVAVLIQPDPPSLLLIDDLDKGLHPAAFSELVKVLRAAQQANPSLQIVATTHSPYLLGCFEAQEVRIFARKPDGSAACSKLTDHPDYEHWKDSLDPGEFWASVGEEWVLAK
jgi:predicted ATPase